MPDTDQGSYFVRAAARTLEVIRCFDAEHPRQTLSEIAHRTDLDRATARRLLLTLRDLGYVEQGARDFALAPRVLELGYAYLSGASLAQVARPHLQRVADSLHETASLTVLDGLDVVYLDVVSGGRIAAVQIKVGTRFRAHATSMGRVLLSGLPGDELDAVLARVTAEERHERTVRSMPDLRAEVLRAGEQGWAVVDEELEVGLTGVAVPVPGRSGRPVAAVNVSAHAHRSSVADLVERYVPALQAAAAAIARDHVPS